MRIAVAMSGGVDSSVAALLLKEAGHEPVGLSMQLWDHSREAGRTGRCCTLDDLSDARRVAWALDIRHYVLNLEDEFRRDVVRPFVASYLSGETPIPCSACNAKVKFATLWERARALGCEAVATGHYVRRGLRRRGPSRPPEGDRSGQGPVLLSLRPHGRAARGGPLPGGGADQGRRCAPAPAARASRRPTRRRARRSVSSRSALAREISSPSTPRSSASSFPPRPGLSKTPAARASALTRGTFASRSGSGGASAWPRRRGSTCSRSTPRPTASSWARAATWRRAKRSSATPGLPAELRRGPFRAAVRIRHRAPEVPATVSPRDDGTARVEFDAPVRAVAPGQSCVFYDGDVVLGGGVLRRSCTRPPFFQQPASSWACPSASVGGGWKSERISP